MDVNKIRHGCDSEDVRRGNDNAAQLLTNSSSLVQAHAIFDPIFAPVRRLPAELLAKIFIECIPFETSLFSDDEMHPQQIRARLGQVCRLWSAILNDEPGVWAILVLDFLLLPLEIVSLWIKRSKSHPLDVSLNSLNMDTRDAIVSMLHKELWRIRSFFVQNSIDYYDTLPLFPSDLSTEAPMMQSLTIQCDGSIPELHLGCIRCPQLRTLTLWNCDKAVEHLFPKPLQNLRVLTIIDHHGDDMLYIKLLQALPNLVSLRWSNAGPLLHDVIPRVVLRSLKSLTFESCLWETTKRLLTHLDIPSLEHLDLEHCRVVNAHPGALNMILDVICSDGAAQLRRLTLGDRALRRANWHAMWHPLKHLETLSISGAHGIAPVNELFISLSPSNRDFSSVCPQLKTLELDLPGKISTDALVNFVQRRVKSDLGDPAPGLVTCLKLSYMMLVDDEVSAQLAKTHSLSVHLPRY